MAADHPRGGPVQSQNVKYGAVNAGDPVGVRFGSNLWRYLELGNTLRYIPKAERTCGTRGRNFSGSERNKGNQGDLLYPVDLRHDQHWINKVWLQTHRDRSWRNLRHNFDTDTMAE